MKTTNFLSKFLYATLLSLFMCSNVLATIIYMGNFIDKYGRSIVLLGDLHLTNNPSVIKQQSENFMQKLLSAEKTKNPVTIILEGTPKTLQKLAIPVEDTTINKLIETANIVDQKEEASHNSFLIFCNKFAKTLSEEKFEHVKICHPDIRLRINVLFKDLANLIKQPILSQQDALLPFCLATGVRASLSYFAQITKEFLCTYDERYGGPNCLALNNARTALSFIEFIQNKLITPITKLQFQDIKQEDVDKITKYFNQCLYEPMEFLYCNCIMKELEERTKHIVVIIGQAHISPTIEFLTDCLGFKKTESLGYEETLVDVLSEKLIKDILKKFGPLGNKEIKPLELIKKFWDKNILDY